MRLLRIVGEAGDRRDDADGCRRAAHQYSGEEEKVMDLLASLYQAGQQRLGWSLTAAGIGINSSAGQGKKKIVSAPSTKQRRTK